MPSPTMRYANNERAAQAIVRAMDALVPPVRDLKPRPLDSSARAFAEWWFLPGTGRPLPGHGKLFLRRQSNSGTATMPGLMAIGFQLERGLGRQLAGTPVGEAYQPDLVERRFVMQPSWLWYRFLNDAMGGLFDPPLRSMLERSGEPVAVELDLFRVDTLPAAWAGRGCPDDRLTFAVLDESLLLHPTSTATGELAVLDDAATLRELVLRMEGVQDLTWFWIAVSIGIEVAYGYDEGDWDAATLWTNALEPWLPWVH